MSVTEQVKVIVVEGDTLADRPAASKEARGTFFYDRSTQITYLLEPDAGAGFPTWIIVGNGSSAANGFPLQANGDANGFKIVDSANPTPGSQDLATAFYVDAGDASTLAAAEAYTDTAATVVHTTGTETVAGDKTFSGNETYSGGTNVPDTAQGISFTASKSVSRYRLTATGITMTLDSADPDGTTYEAWNATKSSTPNITFAPNGGLKINVAGLYTQTSINLNIDFIARSITKMNGEWWIAS